MNIRTLVLLVQKTLDGYFRDNCSQISAAIAYHILFSLVPLVMFIVSVLGILIGTDAVQQRLTDAVSQKMDLSTANVSLELSSAGASRLESQYGLQAADDVDSHQNHCNGAFATGTGGTERWAVWPVLVPTIAVL